MSRGQFRLVPLAKHGRSSLLADAIYRVAQSEIPAYAIVVDAIDNNAARFYEHFGFLKLGRNPRTFFLPLSTAIKSLGSG